MSSVSIVDYGVGNLLSVARAFQYFDASVNLVSTPEEIMSADRLVLPGVGAFEDGMKGLTTLNFIEPIKQFARSGKPFLGICLGMQMMLSRSTEFGQHEGLDLIAGEVVSVPSHGVDGQLHKIPHIGWNELVSTSEGEDWCHTILKNIPLNSSVYFVHSFMAMPSNPKKRLADTLYDGQVISAVIKDENMYGCQFHPEKSGEVGLNIIQQFLQI
ncbi:TPA: imidazole glycerol phosphate synthase subunit HisH [Legionella pneumophila]|uniref:imidazole glycerol phosphate synthase subunit HisH n=1 Tax=Legionella pneumophila TaxID=446 RepID=UPI0007709D26|nr:imidazole glycerol phosphate synthase subunit HisH [Legionella pneumophila]HAT9304965.1 imidazole glycerol phosphate synthase subunit HisH [Legionella pneumophila subsp. pneumophila]CZG53328.1 Imidazole glycerol phosphate synthase subunit HisH 1 [Legionella pneumophila]HAT1966314.1 imidazole glycerol phosphate synthase subunit HisH [Legionella pneumophila]HAT9404294.1 imidazole glycerol phosphate synthase subunit HisH [Legionella pneumophila subsp. pneumophila]HAT9418826.1 imidazole glycero